MKKLALAALLSVPMLAMAQNSYYIQGDVGFSRPKVETGGRKLNGNEVSYGVAVGKQLQNNARVEADYTHYGKTGKVMRDGAEFEAQGIGLSAIYDFKNDTNFTPYLGVKVSANRLDIKKSDGTNDERTRAGIGGVAGVQYQMNPNLALDGGVEYNHLGKISGSNADQYGAKVGARVNF
ncbi:MAG: opacity family porin [Moraxella sp.]